MVIVSAVNKVPFTVEINAVPSVRITNDLDAINTVHVHKELEDFGITDTDSLVIKYKTYR